MTQRRGEGFDVPITPIGGSRGRSPRRTVAIVAVAAIAAGWLLVAAVTGWDGEAGRTGQSSHPPGAVAVGPDGSAEGSAAQFSSRAPGGASGASDTRRVGPDLPVIPNRPLVGAPKAVFVIEEGRDAGIVAWRPGGTFLRQLRPGFPDAFRGRADDDMSVIAWPAPDLSSVVVSEVRSPSGLGDDSASVVTTKGVAWESDGVTALGGLAWSGLGDRFAVAGRQDRWLLVGRGASWDAVSATEVDVSAGRVVALGGKPTQRPGSVFALADRIRPFAFSRSGDWVVGARQDPAAAALAPAVRVRFADGQVEPIAAFPVIGGPDGLGSGPTRLVDVTTGRTVALGPNASIPGGPPQLEIREPDGTFAFGVRSAIVIDWLWTGDGRLVVLGADGAPFPTRWTLQLVEPDGRMRTLVDAPRASGGALLGIREAHLGLLLTGSAPERSQIVIVRLSDGVASSITVPTIGRAGPIGSGLTP